MSRLALTESVGKFTVSIANRKSGTAGFFVSQMLPSESQKALLRRPKMIGFGNYSKIERSLLPICGRMYHECLLIQDHITSGIGEKPEFLHLIKSDAKVVLKGQIRREK
jgi:hypothetical protein